MAVTTPTGIGYAVILSNGVGQEDFFSLLHGALDTSRWYSFKKILTKIYWGVASLHVIAYSRDFPDHFSQLDIELACFLHRLQPEDGGLGPFEHFKNAVHALWPEGNRKHFIFTPQSERMLRAAIDYSYLGVAGGASMCKSDTFAVYGIVNWLADPVNTLVLFTSTSLKDSRKRIWGSVIDYFTSAEIVLPGKLVDSVGAIRTVVTGMKTSDRCGMHLIPGEKKKEKDSIGKLIGIKQQRLLVLGDELSELSPALIEACSNLSNNPYFAFIGLANPSSIYDPHGQLCTPVDGWNSVDVENSSGWVTEKGYCVRLDAEESTNYKERKVVYPFMPSFEKIEQAKQQWGEKSRAYARMYKSYWCPDTQEITIFTEADMLKAGASRRDIAWLGEPTPVGGLDLGYSTGGDRTVLVHGLYGDDRDNIPTLLIQGHQLFHDDTSKRDVPRNFQIAEQVRDACVKLNIEPRNLALDVTGSGGAFLDILTVTWDRGPLGVVFGGWASDRMMGAPGNRKKASDIVSNRATELWLAARDYILNGQIRGIFPALGAELVNRKTEDRKRDSSTYIAIESKPSLRKRTGKSCDIADAAIVLVELCRTRFKFKSTTRPEFAKGEEAMPTKKPQPSREKWRRLTAKMDVSGNSGRNFHEPNDSFSIW